MTKLTSFPIIAALAIGTPACGNNNARNTTATSTGANAPAADQRSDNASTPMTLMGCLQQDARTFIVPRLTEPSRIGVATTGNGAAVAQEQLRESANAYRLYVKEQT